MLNQISIQGRMVRDQELRTTSGGKSVTSFTLACERDFRGGDGGKITDFIDCVAWSAAAEFIARNFSKGKMALVTGSLQFREWTDKYGNKRRNAEVNVNNIYFTESKLPSAPQYSAPDAGFQEIEDPEDNGDLPF